MKPNHKFGKRAAEELRGLKYIFAIFGIFFMFALFYVWVQQNVTKQSQRQAEITAAEIEFKAFYSELVKTYGIEIAKASTGDAAQIIEKFSQTYSDLPKGAYTAKCSQTNKDKDCTLTITLNEGLSTVLDWTLYISAVTAQPVALQLILFKLIASQTMKENFQESYIPLHPNQATQFTLRIMVKYV